MKSCTLLLTLSLCLVGGCKKEAPKPADKPADKPAEAPKPAAP